MSKEKVSKMFNLAKFAWKIFQDGLCQLELFQSMKLL